MMKQIRILIGELAFNAELNDSATAKAIWDALPMEETGSRWGEEIYFSIPVACEPSADARDEMQVGELAYWPPGSAFCIFWGPTPASHGSEPRAASAVNPIGMLNGSPDALAAELNAATESVVRIERAD